MTTWAASLMRPIVIFLMTMGLASAGDVPDPINVPIAFKYDVSKAVPSQCADPSGLSRLLFYISNESGKKDSDRQYYCYKVADSYMTRVINDPVIAATASKTWIIDINYALYALVAHESAYKTLTIKFYEGLDEGFFKTDANALNRCGSPWRDYGFGTSFSTPGYVNYSGRWTSEYNGFDNNRMTKFGTDFANAGEAHNYLKQYFITFLSNPYRAYSVAQNCWFASAFDESFVDALSNGGIALNSDGTPYSADLPSPGTGGTGGTGTTPPAGSTPTTCKDSAGTDTTNQYNCTPSDTDSKCRVLDIPCNLKYLFIPRKDFLVNKIKGMDFGINLKMPVKVVHSLSVEINLGTLGKVPFGFNFGPDMTEETKDQYRFVAFWATFLFLLRFLGIPFLGAGRGGGADLREASVKWGDNIKKGRGAGSSGSVDMSTGEIND